MATEDRRERWQTGRTAASRKLKLQLGISLAVFLFVTVVVVYQILRDQLDPFWPLVGFAAGLLLGTALARTRSLHLDAAGHSVVSSMTVAGVAVLIVYIVLMWRRDVIFGRFVSSATIISVAALAVTGGVMLGRTLVTFRGVRDVLQGAGVLPDH